MNMKLRDVLKGFFQSRNDTYTDQLKTIDKSTGKLIDPYVKIDYNIYEAGPTLKEYVDQSMRIHQHWKHKFAYPALYFGKKVLGKYLVKEVPDSVQFKNLRIFDKAFEKSLKTWSMVCSYKEKGGGYTQADVDEHMTRSTVAILRMLKEFVLTIVKNDTAYLEFMNFLMFNIAIKMNESYPSDPAHIVYAAKKITDVGYFMAVLSKEGLGLREIRSPSRTPTVIGPGKIKDILNKGGFDVKEVKIEEKQNETAITATTN